MWKSGQCVSTARGRGLLHLFQYRFRSEIPESRNRNHFRCFPISFSMAKSGTPASCWIYRSCRTRILNNSARQRPQELKYSYFNAGRQMHSYIASFLNAFPERRQQHLDSALTYQQRIISTLPPRIKKHTYHLAEYYFQSGRPRIAEAIFENLLDSLPTTSNLRARAAHHLATIARGRGDNQLSLYYLAESACSDIEAATRNTLAPGTWGAVTE